MRGGVCREGLLPCTAGETTPVAACLETLQKGDELVVSKLDRLGRSQVEVINRLADLQERGSTSGPWMD